MSSKDNDVKLPIKFNVRVYGVYIKEGALLVSDEFRMGMNMTKLPGGGLEFGEGIEEGLAREWKEELNSRITIQEIIYVKSLLSAFCI